MTVSPRLIKGGLVTLDPATGAVLRVLPMQYNPDTVTRSLTPKATGAVEGDRSEALRLIGPAVETLSLEAEIDLTDDLEHPGQVADGLHPQIAALEGLLNPTVQTLRGNESLASQGRLEIIPMQAPLTVLVWSRHRVVPGADHPALGHRGGLRHRCSTRSGPGSLCRCGCFRSTTWVSSTAAGRSS